MIRKPKTIKKRLLSGLLAALMCATVLSIAPIPAFAAPQEFHVPAEVKPIPINFLNGSFEKPVLDSVPTQYTPNPDVKYYIAANYPGAQVPGWNTIAVDPAQRNLPYANCIQFFGYGAEGSQGVELNAHYPGRLYQNVAAISGTQIYWSFKHRAIDSIPPVGNDVLNFYLRPAGTPEINPGTEYLVCSAIDNPYTWGNYNGIWTVPAGWTNIEFAYESVSSWTGNDTGGNLLDDIKFQVGPSLILEKAITDSAGNRVDLTVDDHAAKGAVRNAHALKGEIVTITVDITNWGEMDASRCVFTDVLSPSLEYIPNSAKIGDVNAGALATYNDGTLRVNYGAGASAGTENTNGGVLNGSVTTGTAGTTGQGATATISFQAKVIGDAGAVVKNQAQSTYNGLHFEVIDNIAQPDFTAYSGVADLDTNASTERTYVNTFTIGERKISGDGVVWIDANENGNIDAGERKASGLTVNLMKVSGSTETLARDANGNNLTTTTDSNGNYTFETVPVGTYRVVMEVPEGYRVVSPRDNSLAVSASTAQNQGNPHNNAVQRTNNGKTEAVIGDIAFTTDFTPTTHGYYVHNADIGLIPTTAIKKDAFISSSTTAANGEENNPQVVDIGETITYKITVTNNATNDGDTINKTVTVDDFLTRGLTLESVSPTPNVNHLAVTGERQLQWVLSSLPKGDTVLTIVTTVEPILQTITNKASVQIGTETPKDTNSTYHTVGGMELTVSKTVKGTLADPGRGFIFNVTLTDKDSNALTSPIAYTGASSVTGVAAPSNSSMTLAAGAGSITLKHGQSITFTGLPIGVKYTVTETGASDYTVTGAVTNATANTLGTANTGSFTSGTATGALNNNNAGVAFTNTKMDTPPTGVLLDVLPYIILAALVIAVVVLILVLRGRRRGGSRGGRHSNGSGDEYRGL